jgi:hypothetical protein
MTKLAVALDVTVDQVAVAALRAAGVPVTGGLAASIPGFERLTAPQRDVVERLVEVMNMAR